MREELGMNKEQRAMAEAQSDSRGAQVSELKVGGGGQDFVLRLV